MVYFSTGGYKDQTAIKTCNQLLNNKINLIGVHTPIEREIYNPVLKELEANGINFEEY